MFPATIAWIRRGRRSVALRLEEVLRGFVALLRAFATLGGFGLFQTGTRQVLGRPWLFVGGALRGMGTSWTLSAGVMLTGPDPVPQLPVNLDGSRSIRLHKKKNKELDFLKEENKKILKRTIIKKKNLARNFYIFIFSFNCSFLFAGSLRRFCGPIVCLFPLDKLSCAFCFRLIFFQS